MKCIVRTVSIVWLQWYYRFVPSSGYEYRYSNTFGPLFTIMTEQMRRLSVYERIIMYKYGCITYGLYRDYLLMMMQVMYILR